MGKLSNYLYATNSNIFAISEGEANLNKSSCS